MPAARGVKRTASKSSSSASSAPKNKKKRGIQLEVPTASKKQGKLFVCGQGDVGQLGLGDDVQETTKFKQVLGLGDKIVDACAGGMHTIALDSSGKVWSFGCNDEGALGRSTSSDTEEGTPGKVLLPFKAVAISCGDSHSAALLINGDVYAWGAFRDSHGSMGLVVRGREGKSCRDPVKMDIGEPAAHIASGGDHLVVLSTSGAIYTMGCGEQGQLGRLSQRSATRDARQGFSALLTPGKVSLKAGASQIWAGYHATFALDSNDKMFAWGLNNYGQLGITGEKRKTALFAPSECDAFTNINMGWRSVACGQHHTLALDVNGQVYSIGRCEYGRLGLGEKSGDAETLEQVPKLQTKKCISIATGTSNSFAVTDAGEILSWGMGTEGQLGTGESTDALEPTSVDLPSSTSPISALLVSAGGQHTLVLAGDPNAKKEPTPQPEEETSEEQVETEVEPEELPESKPRPTKRQKKQQKEEEEDIESSASNAQVNTDDNKPQDLNGDKKKEAPMEIDETDKPTLDNNEEVTNDDKNQETKQDDIITDTLDEKQDTDTHEEEDSKMNDDSQDTKEQSEPKEDTKSEVTVTSSQEAIDSDSKSQDSENKDTVNDVEMTEKPELNGTEETPVVESKTVEETIPSANVLTTTA